MNQGREAPPFNMDRLRAAWQENVFAQLPGEGKVEPTRAVSGRESGIRFAARPEGARKGSNEQSGIGERTSIARPTPETRHLSNDLRDRSGRHIEPRIGRCPGPPIPMTGNSVMRLEMLDWLGFGLIMRLKASAIARRPGRPNPGVRCS